MFMLSPRDFFLATKVFRSAELDEMIEAAQHEEATAARAKKGEDTPMFFCPHSAPRGQRVPGNAGF